MKIVSWNVNGIRAIMKKDFVKYFNELSPDVLCLQETKAQDLQVIEALAWVTGGYKLYTNSAERKGYSGTAILVKGEHGEVLKDIGIEEHDNEGRVTGVELSDFYVINVYVPNSGGELARLDYREKWDKDFLAYLKNLEKKKPVIVCGDLNVAHQEIDLARPKSNYNKTSGYTQREIDGLTNFLNEGFMDIYRTLYPDTIAYSWWSYRFGAKEKNIGWRIDYFLASETLKSKIIDSKIHPDISGSDHCPISLEIK